MTAARLDLGIENSLAIEQGADYGPVVFRLRHRQWDEYDITINAAGTDGDVFTVSVFTAESDRPELEASASYIKQAGDDADAVSLGLQAVLAALTLDVIDPDTGAVVPTPLTTFVRITDLGSGSFNIKAISKAVYLGIQATGTVPANITLVHTNDVQVDLTAATAAAEIREYQSSPDVLVTWTTSNYLEIVTPATRGILTLNKVPAAVTTGYTFESGWWQLDVTPSETRRWFEGLVENRLSLLLQ
jgi:hypothetical protein